MLQDQIRHEHSLDSAELDGSIINEISSHLSDTKELTTSFLLQSLTQQMISQNIISSRDFQNINFSSVLSKGRLAIISRNSKIDDKVGIAKMGFGPCFGVVISEPFFESETSNIELKNSSDNQLSDFRKNLLAETTDTARNNIKPEELLEKGFVYFLVLLPPAHDYAIEG